MNSEYILMDNDDIDFAQEVCKFIQEGQTRSRAVSNVIAAKIAEKYFVDTPTDTHTGIYRISQVLENIEISDIYINNNYIDVRLCFDEKDLYVPKSHFDKDIMPLAYMFIKVNEELTEANVLGFILSGCVNTMESFGSNYKVDEMELVPFEDIKPHLFENNSEYIDETFEIAVFDYLDNRLEDTNAFYKTLISSVEAREFLYKAAYAKNILKDFNSENSTEAFNDSESLGSFDNQNEFTEINLITENDDNLELIPLESPISLEDTSEDLNLYEENEEFTIQPEAEYTTLVTPSLASFEEDSDNQISFNESDEILYNDSVSDNSDEFIVTDITENEFEPETMDIVNETTEDITLPKIGLTLESEMNSETETNTTAKQDSDILLSFLEDDSTPVSEYSDTTDFDKKDSVLDTLFNAESNEDSHNTDEDIELMATESEDIVSEEDANIEEDLEDVVPTQRRNSILPLVGGLVIIAAIGYYGYSRFATTPTTESNVAKTLPLEQVSKPKTNVPVQEAMPIETVENIENKIATEEAIATSIPAIEDNLDASILVSNLSVNWEVPSGYVSNTTAKKYFTKIGKVIQLNLKTEMLLLTKPPITNKITVELEYNKSKQKFDIKGFVISSGEKTVDALIKQTLQNVLDIKLSTNMSIFENIKGNPVLVINL